jgi:AraC-like DNA-binding protein
MLQIQTSNFITDRSLRSTTKIGRYAIGNHIHQNTEIVFVKDGYIDVTVDGVSERAYKNDVIVISPFKTHSFKTERYAEIWICVFSNDFISDFVSDSEGYLSGREPIFSPSKELVDFITPKLFDSSENLITPNDDMKRRVKTVFYAIFEEYFTAVPKEYKSTKGNALSSILIYIAENCKSDINLDTVSKSLGYNKNYISQCLGELGGINFRTLLNSFRIEHAKKMLLAKKYKLIDVALECGFTCERTFYRAFLSITGKTPSAYTGERLDADFITVGRNQNKTIPYVTL